MSRQSSLSGDFLSPVLSKDDRIMRLPYKNPNDPRTFVYLSGKHKWLSVVLNFAYVRSWIYYFLTMTGWLIFFFCVPERPMICFAGVVAWFILWQIFYFCGAAHDFKKYPGAPSFRD